MAIQPTWDWCLACGFDPEHKKPAGWQPTLRGAATLLPTTPAAPQQAYQPYEHQSPSHPAPGYAPAYVAAPRASQPAQRVITIVVAVVVFVAIFGARVVLTSNSTTSAAHATTTEPPVTTTPALATPEVWTPWSAPDNSFTISFPGVPTVSHLGNETEGNEKVWEARGTGRSATYGIAWIDAKPGYYVADPRKDVNDGIKQIVYGMDVSGRDDAPYSGLTASRVTGKYTMHNELTSAQGNDVVTAMVLVAGDRLVFIYAYGHTAASFDFDGYVSTFHLGG